MRGLGGREPVLGEEDEDQAGQEDCHPDLHGDSRHCVVTDRKLIDMVAVAFHSLIYFIEIVISSLLKQDVLLHARPRLCVNVKLLFTFCKTL